MAGAATAAPRRAAGPGSRIRDQPTHASSCTRTSGKPSQRSRKKASAAATPVSQVVTTALSGVTPRVRSIQSSSAGGFSAPLSMTRPPIGRLTDPGIAAARAACSALVSPSPRWP